MESNKPDCLKRPFAIGAYVAVVVLLAVGSFFDLAFSQAVYEAGSVYGYAIQAYSPYVLSACAFGGLALAVRALLLTRDTSGIAIVVPAAIISIGLAIGVYIYGIPTTGGGPMDVALLAAFSALGFIAFWGTEVREVDVLRAWSVFLVAFPLACLASVEVIKQLWGRPRFWAISSTEGLDFRPWWVMGTELARSFRDSGELVSDAFKSFPSGHTANSVCFIAILTLLPVLRPRLAGRGARIALATVGIVCVAAVAFGRIRYGMHFITDVTAGFCVGYTMLLVIGKAAISHGRS